MRTPEEVLKRADPLRVMRALHEPTWQELADFLRPLRKEVGNRHLAKGQRRHQGIMDSSPILAREHFVSGIYGMMTNPANRWFELEVDGDPELGEHWAVKEWLEATTEIVSASFSPAVSGFYKQVVALYSDLSVFGTAVHYSAEIVGQERIYDACRSLGECLIATNDMDEVDLNYREFEFTTKQARDKWGDKAPERIRMANDDTTMWKFVHAVEPNEAFDDDPDRPLSADNKPFTDHYVSVETKETVGEPDGFYEFPFQIPRWAVVAGETWGRGPGEVVLADIKSLNRQTQANLTAGHRAAEPPILAANKKRMGAGSIRLTPNGVNYGGMSPEGRPLIAPLGLTGNVPFALEMTDRTREGVKDGFYFSLMQLGWRSEHDGHRGQCAPRGEAQADGSVSGRN